MALLKWGRPAMADLSRYFSTARKFFLRYFLRIVNENCAKLYFLAKKIFSGKTNGLAIFCVQKFAQNLTARNFCAMNDLAERLISLRTGLSRREFAKNLGITESTLRNYEKGASSPDAQFLTELCKKMNLSPEWLLFGTHAVRSTGTSTPKVEASIEALPSECPRCGKLERDLELEKEERRELATDNRRLYREKEELYREKEQLLREKEELLRENGTLREKLVRLEAERGKRCSGPGDEGEFPTLFDEQRTIPPSSRGVESVHK